MSVNSTQRVNEREELTHTQTHLLKLHTVSSKRG